MLRWFFLRLLGLVPTLFIIVTLSFLIIRLAPGSPFATDKAMPPAVRLALEERFGLSEPIYLQLANYLGRLVQGDMGPSLRYPQHDVRELFALGVGPTATLALTSLTYGLVWGIGWAFLSAWALLERRRRIDSVITTGIALMMGAPSFVLGPLLALGIAVMCGLCPPAGWGTPLHLILPTLTLGSMLAAQVARLVRGGLLAAIDQPFMRQARAKGLSSTQLLFTHALKAGLLPLLSYLPPTLSGLLVGSVAIERIFMIPGLGLLFVDAAFNRDYFVVMGIVVFESSVLLILNALVDATYALLDPRVRFD